MNEAKKQFIELLAESGAVLFGDFTAKSGRKTPYFINTGKLTYGDQLDMVGRMYAQTYVENIGKEPRILFGPAYKGIPLAVTAAAALAKEGLDLPFFFNRKEAKDHGEGGQLVGYVPRPGQEAVIIEDVITAGTAIRESMALFEKLEGVKVAAAFVMVDRKEKGQGEKSAIAEVEELFGFPVYSIADVYDILEYLAEDEKNAAHIARIKAYLSVNGAKA